MRAGAKHFGPWATGTVARTVMVLVVLVVTACSGGGPVGVDTEARGQVDAEAPGSEPPAPPPTPATTTTTAPSPATEPPTTQPPTAQPPTAQPPPVPPPAVGTVPVQGLGPGDRGPQVKVLEDLLAALMYGVHTIDDLYDQVPDGTPVYVLDGKTPPGPPPPEGTQT